MPPRRRVRSEPFLTPERRLELLEQIRARREARIAAGLPPDAVDPEEEDEPEEENVGDAGDADLQAEQQAILDSLQSESAAEARRRRRQEAEAEHAAEVDEMLAYMDKEEEELFSGTTMVSSLRERAIFFRLLLMRRRWNY